MAGTDMDPEVARGLFEVGATLVLLGVPQGSVLGLGYKTWTLGPRFRGVKMIPPGLHFLNSNEACGDIGPKTGLFLSLKPRELLVAHWNQREDELEFSMRSASSGTQRRPSAYGPTSENWTPTQITQCNMDRSYALNSVLERHYKEQPLGVLGELQFALVCFLVGNVYEAFEHWKSLQALLCRSEEAMKERKDLYPGLIAVLCHQLGEIPPHFFVDIVSQNDFLPSTLQFASSPGVDSTLRKRAEQFQVHLTKRFRWDFDADLDECAPVLVELPAGVTLD
uniref:Protein AAR2 homolog n=1 Tax=Sinocyclocheilus rhinocerous TaxID=307959 RepID=A0A673J7F2_9TELE